MNLSTLILGHHAVEKLQQTAKAAVLEIGSDRLTRAQLARVGCFNFTAAKNLSAVLHHELQVKNLQQVFDEIPPDALALPRIGVVSLAVLGAAFEAKGIGGAAPLEAYARKHLPKGVPADHLTTWHTMKQHALDEQAEERKAKKSRKRARQRQAHETRVERFIERKTASASPAQ